MAPTRTLRSGLSGTDVRDLQVLLNKLTPELPPLSEDGIFGPNTAGRVKSVQAANGFVVNGFVDPALMQALLVLLANLGNAGVTAKVERKARESRLHVAADPTTVDGAKTLGTVDISPTLTRLLISTTGTSIKWFGVVLPEANASTGRITAGSPFVFFTPGPFQGDYYDNTYDKFTKWTKLWSDYSLIIGSQLMTASKSRILVIPFYKNSQHGKLGTFLKNWKETITAVVTAALDEVDPFLLRDKYEFSQMSTCSFSSGVLSHKNFHIAGAGVSDATKRVYLLDGMANKARSTWHPKNGVIYQSLPAGPHNPVGTIWNYGGRTARLLPRFPHAKGDHNLAPCMLLHGLKKFSH